MAIMNINEENFRVEVAESEQTVLLDFWAPWCGPCRMVSPVLEQIAAEREDIKIGKINVDEQGELAGLFGIMSIPTLMVVKGGKVVNQAVGALPKSAILDLL